mmetsp:Transcript_47949/g.136958  ORF Transcript_47949/g.136958 Transcript_47949/m.136958 type:complete len:279 (-) Transcript_47949:537-1373(-)
MSLHSSSLSPSMPPGSPAAFPPVRSLARAAMAAQCARKLPHAFTSWSRAVKMRFMCALRRVNRSSSKPWPWPGTTGLASNEQLPPSAIHSNAGEALSCRRLRFSGGVQASASGRSGAWAGGASGTGLHSAAGSGLLGSGQIKSSPGDSFSRKRLRFGPGAGGHRGTAAGSASSVGALQDMATLGALEKTPLVAFEKAPLGDLEKAPLGVFEKAPPAIFGMVPFTCEADFDLAPPAEWAVGMLVGLGHVKGGGRRRGGGAASVPGSHPRVRNFSRSWAF